MTVRLRMSIHGKRNNRIFHLVAIDLRKRRDAQPIETLGIYRPALKHGETEKRVEWSVERIKYWLKVGAQPSKTFERLLNLGGIVPLTGDKRQFKDESASSVAGHVQT